MSDKKDVKKFINDLIDNSQIMYDPMYSEQNILTDIQHSKDRIESENEVIERLRERLAEIRLRNELAKEAKYLLNVMV